MAQGLPRSTGAETPLARADHIGKALTELAGKIADGALSVGPVREFDFEDFEQAFASLKAAGQPGRTVLRLS